MSSLSDIGAVLLRSRYVPSLDRAAFFVVGFTAVSLPVFARVPPGGILALLLTSSTIWLALRSGSPRAFWCGLGCGLAVRVMDWIS